jgi:DNA-binding CsgD family transcriptional regulator
MPAPQRRHPVQSEAFMIVKRDGSIMGVTPQARRWLKEFFAPARKVSRLPSVICQWLKRHPAKGERRCKPFVCETARAQLVIRLLHPEANNAFCLLLQERPFGKAPPRSHHIQLTPRQREVLNLIADARSNVEIAKQLGIAHSTVKRHVEDILAKLGADNRTAAAVIGRDFRP